MTTKRTEGPWSRIVQATCIAVIFAVGLALAPPAFAATSPDQAAPAAISCAQTFLKQMRSPGRFAEWRRSTLSSGTVLYDPDGAVTGFAFTVLSGGLDDGYITVRITPDGDQIAEFSHATSPVGSATGTPIGPLPAGPQHHIYSGPLRYQTRVSTGANSTYSVDGPLKTLAKRAATATSDKGGVSGAYGTSYKVISGVPDYNQFYYDYTSSEYNDYTVPAASGSYATDPYLDTGGSYACGCSVTSGANVIGYWDTHGYPNLVTGALPMYAPTYDPDSATPDSPSRSTRQKLINDLHIYMHSWRNGDEGYTYDNAAGPGVAAYAQQIGGYGFTSNMISSAAFSTYVTEIDASRPTILCFGALNVTGPTTTQNYGDHAITGVGYDYTPGSSTNQFLITRDNWENTPTDVYVQYGGAGSYASYSRFDLIAIYPPAPPPVNDAFASAIAVSGTSGSRSSDTNVGATLEANEPVPTNGQASVWYSWTAPYTGAATVDTIDSSFDTMLAIYTGSSVGGLSFVTSDDDSGGNNTSQASFSAVAGTTYRIQVTGFAGATGALALHWSLPVTAVQTPSFSPGGGTYSSAQSVTISCATAGATIRYTTDGTDPTSSSAVYSAPVSIASSKTLKARAFKSGMLDSAVCSGVYTIVSRPVNDDFAGIVISGVSGSRSGDSNTNATLQSGEPVPSSLAAASVWYSWTAPVSGTTTITVTPSGFTSGLGLYTGSSVGALSTLGTTTGSTNRLTFSATAGTVYRIQVTGISGGNGSFSLSWTGPGTVATPSFSPAGGTYSAAQSVTISCATAGATVRYTTDGTDPTSSSAVYSSPVSVASSTTLKARAFKSGLLDSAVCTGVYTIVSRPVNDDFAGISITGVSGTRSGDSNVNGTLEPSEPASPVGRPVSSVWYSWTAPTSGPASIDTFGSSFDTVLCIYTGSSVGGLSLVTYNDDTNGGSQSLANFTAVAGTTYRIRVTDYAGATGSITLHWLGSAPRAATPQFSPAGGTYHAEQIVAITSATTTAAIHYTTDGSDPDANSPLYTAPITIGFTCKLKAIAISPGMLSSYVSSADFVILAPPPNDMLAHGTVITGASGSLVGDSNLYATLEPDEPLPSSMAGASVWYSWTAPSTGWVTFNTFGSSFDTLLGVYVGTSCPSLSPVVFNDDTALSALSEVSFAAIAGQTYRIQVTGWGASTGSLALRWGPSPANDQFPGIKLPSDVSGYRSGDLSTFATMEPGEPLPSASRHAAESVWYSWTAPVTQAYSFDTMGSGYDTVMAIFTGPDVAHLSEITSNDDALNLGQISRVWFRARAGTTYYVQITGYQGATGGVSVNWQVLSPFLPGISRSPSGNKTLKRVHGKVSYTLSSAWTTPLGPLVGERVFLQTSANGRTWQNTYTMRTNGDGRVALKFTVGKKMTKYYRWTVNTAYPVLGRTTSGQRIVVK